MRRREFITLLGGAAAWPFAAHAQQPAMPVVGSLISYSLDQSGLRLLSDIRWRREHAEAGGLLSYGPSLAAMFRQTAGIVVKIIRGAKPADLPVEQPTKFELVVNPKTAKSLGLTIPPSILLRADEVIE